MNIFKTLLFILLPVSMFAQLDTGSVQVQTYQTELTVNDIAEYVKLLKKDVAQFADQSGADLAMTTAYKQVTLDSEITASDNFAVDGTGTITYTGDTKLFKIYYHVSAYATVANRLQLDAIISINDVDIPLSASHVYAARHTSYTRQGSTSREFIYQLNTGDTIKLRAKKDSTGRGVIRPVDSANIIFEQVY